VTRWSEKNVWASDRSAAELTARIRGGDREALAEAIETYRPLINRYIRMRLRGSLRRLFDTGDVLGTVSRRLDQALRGGTLVIRDDEHLPALIQRMVRQAVVDKHRLLTRLRSVEGPDSAWARRFLDNADHAAPDGPEVEDLLHRAFGVLDDPRDRRILAMWFHGLSHAEIGERLGFTPSAVRQRWHRVRFRLKEAFAREDA
jgi:RNA polymerase sigma factor (sigma-70 family)